jgi:hypothetical protein
MSSMRESSEDHSPFQAHRPHPHDQAVVQTLSHPHDQAVVQTLSDACCVAGVQPEEKVKKAKKTGSVSETAVLEVLV